MKKSGDFDSLRDRFGRNIYESLKGQIRLDVLQRDLSEFLPRRPLRVLDLGAGPGHMAVWLLAQGHRLTLVDISREMVREARSRMLASGLQGAADVEYWEGSVLDCASGPLKGRSFDLVLCHALLEWLEAPQVALEQALGLLAPGGWCSIAFYNRHGLVFKNLLRGNLDYALDPGARGRPGSLTPVSPLEPTQIGCWLAEAGMQEVCRSGMRVFNDYVLDRRHFKADDQQVRAAELAFSRQSPYRELARYLHFLYRKPDSQPPAAVSAPSIE